MANLKKERQGYGYTYTDLAQVNNYIADNGWEYYQTIETTDDGSDYVITWVNFHNDDTDTWEVRRGCKVPNATLSGKSNPAQEYGSALTYARRYSLFLAFGLATTDDDAACLTIETTKQEKLNKELSVNIEARIENKKKIFADMSGKTIEDVNGALAGKDMTDLNEVEKLLDSWIKKKNGGKPVAYR